MLLHYLGRGVDSLLSLYYVYVAFWKLFIKRRWWWWWVQICCKLRTKVLHTNGVISEWKLTVPDMTNNVFGGTLSLTQSINQSNVLPYVRTNVDSQNSCSRSGVHHLVTQINARRRRLHCKRCSLIHAALLQFVSVSNIFKEKPEIEVSN